MPNKPRKQYVNASSYMGVTVVSIEHNRIQLQGQFTSKKNKIIEVKLQMYDWEMPALIRQMASISRTKVKEASRLLTDVRNATEENQK